MIYLSNMNWTKHEEETAKGEYLSMIGALRTAEEFQHDWTGEWEDFKKEVFGRKNITVKGDKNKYMKYWFENQEIINDQDWNNITKQEDYDEYF